MGFAQEAERPRPKSPAVSEEVVWIFNSLLFLIGGFLVFFMAAGFAHARGRPLSARRTSPCR